MSLPYDLEFNGPFPDWWNVVDDFGADPTGLSDSTGAFQAMLDAMTTNDGNVKSGIYFGYTGYIPNGTYNISGQLLLPNTDVAGTWGDGVNLWGQDPAHTILRASNGYGGNMLWSDGCHSSVIGRITFDGSGTAGTGVRLEHNPATALNNSYSRLQDCIFKDLSRGFEQTDVFSDPGTDSEFSILRCGFYRCGDYGVNVTAAEAYNYWVRQCYFEDCGTAIANGPSGAFSAYDNIFKRSTNYDIYATAMRICGIRRNRSYDSNRFVYLNYSNAIIEGNEVSNSTQVDTVTLDHRFKVMLLNNKFKSADEATTGPVVNEIVSIFQPADVKASPFAPLFAFFNQFTVTDPISITPATPTSNDMFGNIVNPTLTIEEVDPPPQPPQVIRPVYLLDAQNQPQQTIDDAAAYALANPGSRPVVYLPTYTFEAGLKGVFDRTLIFPPNIAMSFQGGGNRAAMRWIEATRPTYLDPYVLFRGPSQVTVQNMTIGFGTNEGHKAGLIAVFDNCDQVNGRVLTDNCKGTYKFADLANLRADVCDHVTDYINPENRPFTVSCLDEANGNSRVLHEAGAGGGGDGFEPIVSVCNGGRYYLRDFWFETTDTDKLWGALSGMGGRPGRLSVETSLIEQHTSPEGWAMKAIEATDWWGGVFYMNDLIIGATKFSGQASRADYLSFGGGSPVRYDSMTPATMYRQDGISYWIVDFGTMSLTMESMTNNGGWGVFGAKPADWQEQLWDAADRKPVVWIDLPVSAVTDVQMHRVRADVTFMSGTYVLQDLPAVVITDFMSGVLPSDATFSRTSSASVYNSATVLEYGPENLCFYSQDISSWTASSGGTGSDPALTPNDAAAPDGTMTATKVVLDSGGGTTIDDWSLVVSNMMGPIFNQVSCGFAFWIKGTAGTQVISTALFPDSPYWQLTTCTGSWQRFQYAGFGGGGTSGPLDIGIRQGTSAGTINSSVEVWLWGVQFGRGNVAPYMPTTSTAAYGLRFDHDPLTGALLGALIEPQSTNGVGDTHEFSGWTDVNVTATADGTVPPDNVGVAAKLIANVGSGDHYIGVTPTSVGAGASVGHSAFVKRGSTQYVVLFDNSDAVWHGATFDFDAGTWVGTGTNVTLASPVRMANGWWRLGWIAIMANDVGAVQIAPTPNGTGTSTDITYDAAGTEYVYTTGPQFDSDGVGVTSFISTRAGVTLTRDADVLKILRDNGTYDIAITRQDGVQLLSGQVISDGTFTVPTSLSPVVRIVTTRTSI